MFDILPPRVESRSRPPEGVAMCYEPTARPPFPPIAGGAGAASSRLTTLEAVDGNRFRAFAATAIDYFGRTAGLDERDEDFDARAHVAQITTEGLRDDVAAGIVFVRSDAGGGAEKVVTVG